VRDGAHEVERLARREVVERLLQLIEPFDADAFCYSHALPPICFEIGIDFCHSAIAR